MTATVHVLPTEAAVELAWQNYSSMARQIVDFPDLAVDDGFIEEMGRREAAWRTLFLLWAQRAA